MRSPLVAPSLPPPPAYRLNISRLSFPATHKKRTIRYLPVINSSIEWSIGSDWRLDGPCGAQFCFPSSPSEALNHAACRRWLVSRRLRVMQGRGVCVCTHCHAWPYRSRMTVDPRIPMTIINPFLIEPQLFRFLELSRLNLISLSSKWEYGSKRDTR